MRTNALLLISMVVVLSACESRTQPPDRAALAQELLQADRDFAALSERSDPKQAFAAYLAPDAMLIGRSGDPVEGYEAALASFGDADRFELLWQPQFAEVAEAADMGWTWGRYQLLSEGELVYAGKYVNIWKRQPDGSWKVRVDMGNQEPQQP